VIGGAAAYWPLAARAQKTVPVIGFLGGQSLAVYTDRLNAFKRGLKEAGYIERQNVGIEYRWADGQNKRLPALAAELVRRQVSVIVAAGGTPSAISAKAATTAIPIVFAVGVDPVRAGLVGSLNRPGGNITGVTSLNVEVGPKRLELVRELLPTASVVAILVNPSSPAIAEPFSRTMHATARALGMQNLILHASSERDFDNAFAAMKQRGANALVIGPDNFFISRGAQLGALALRHAVPAIFQYRPFVAAGGLMSYGSNESEYYRLVGTFAGNILKGAKPADLPVQQSTKVELIINLQTAKALGITVPLPLSGRADELIE
jgi:putative ABC transport system substrate-binding protein